VFRLMSSVAFLLASQVLLLVGHGLQITLIPLRAAHDGFSPAEIGLVGTAYFLGFAFGCIGTPPIARRSGHIRTFAILASVGSALILVFPLTATPELWYGLRFASGWWIAGLYALIESWLNERATNENRGTLMGLYTVVNLSMIVAGQMLVNVADIGSGIGFTLASVLFSAAVVPVALSLDAPAPIRSVRISLPTLWRASHVACLGSLLGGVSTGAFWSLAPVYATAAGLSGLALTGFVSAAVAGGAVFQLPLGRLSDRYDRRVVVIGSAATGAVFASALGFLDVAAPTALLMLSFGFGGFVMPLYALSVAHANDQARPQDFVVVSSGVLLLYGVGAAVGAPVAGALMAGPLGPRALFVLPCVALLALVLGVVERRRVRETPVVEPSEQPFVIVSDLNPLGPDLDPRAPTPEPDETRPLADADGLGVGPDAGGADGTAQAAPTPSPPAGGG